MGRHVVRAIANRGQMTLLLAIDPGKVTGLALFREGLLVAANAANGDTLWSRGSGFTPVDVDEIVIERPCDRPGKNRATINDLIALAIRAGRAAGPWGASVTWYTPVRWKGNLPKEVCWKRACTRLSPQEQALVSDDHNVRDAVALGLYHLRRWQL